MDTKLLLTALLAGVLGPQPATEPPLQPRSPDVAVTAEATGEPFSSPASTVTVSGQGRLIPLGTKVRAPGKTKVPIRVGVKNVGTGVAVPPESGPYPVHVTVYIKVPGDTFAESVTGGTCIPWGPWPEGWGWQHPNEPSYWYACGTRELKPNETHWYELTIVINPKRRLVNGEIYLASDPEVKAAIVIDTRDTLPVTGPPVRDLAIAATALIVPGVLLLFLVTRPPRRRPYHDEN